MITIRKSDERGHFDHGWLDTKHTFSFGAYQDPGHMGFRALRVMNEDRVRPGQGFGTHGHRDMEIISYVMDGAIEHKDSMGNGSVLHRGMFQRMSAGTGVRHSEFNHSSKEPVHFYQIWILPEREGIEPDYEEKSFSNGEALNHLRLVASRDGREGSLLVHQDVAIYLARLERGRSIEHQLADDRHAWMQVLRGRIMINGQSLEEGDGAAISDESRLEIVAGDTAELMFFDLA